MGIIILSVVMFMLGLVCGLADEEPEFEYPNNYAATVVKLSKLLAESPLPSDAFDKIVKNAKSLRGENNG